MNAITLPVSDLKTTALPSLGKLIGRARMLPVLQSIRVTRTNDGAVTLQATDLDSFATFHFPDPQPGPAFDVLAPYEPLNKLVKSLGNKESITLEPDGKDKLKLRYLLTGTEMEQSVESLPVEEFPATPTVNQPGFAVGPEFGIALKQAFQCASQDQSRMVLHGACLCIRDSKLHYIVGTNGRVLFCANSFAFDLKRSITVPNCKFLQHTEMMDEGCMLAVQPPAPKEETGWIKLSSSRWTFIVRENIGPYPKWWECVPLTDSPRTVVRLGPAAIKQILEVLPHLPGDVNPDHKIRLNVQTGQLRVEGPDYEKEIWTGVTVLDVNITGNPLMIALNRNYLATALKFDLNNVEFEDELSPMVFQNGGKKMVIMPVRLSAETTKPAPAPTPVSSTEATAQPTDRATTPATSTTTTGPAAIPASTTERKNEMNTMTAPDRGNLKPTTTATTTKLAETTTPPAVSLTDQIEQIKESVKNVGRDLNNLIDAVKVQERQQRATEREVESARATLKKLQQVTI